MKELKNIPHLTSVTAVLLVMAAIVFHSFNLTYASYDLDEAVHVWFAQKSYMDVIEQSSNDPNPPVYNLMISAWVKTFDVDEWSTRFFSVLMGALAVGVLFLVGARNFGYSVGLMAALLFCSAAIQFRFTHLARPYTLLMVVVIASYGLLLEYFRKPGKRKLIAYCLVTTLMIYVHPTSIFNLPAQGVIILFIYRKNLKTMMLLFGTIVASVALFSLWYLLIPVLGSTLNMWFSAPDLKTVWDVVLSFYGGWYLAAIQGALLFIIIIRFIRGKKVDLRGLVIGFAWFIIPLIGSVIVSHLLKPIFQDKYVLSVHPGMMLLLAISINTAFSGYWKLLPFCLALFYNAKAVNTTPSTEGDWRGVVEYVMERHDENSAVFIHPWYEFRTFSYYFNGDAYRQPKITAKDLYENRIFLNWFDVLPEGADEATVDKLHLITSHGNFVGLPMDMDSLNQNAWLIESKMFSGIKIQSYDLSRGASKEIEVGSIVLDFSDDASNEQTQRFDDRTVKHIPETEEFAITTVVPFESEFGGSTNLRTSMSFFSEKPLEGVFVIVEIVKDENVLEYHSIPLSNTYKVGEWVLVDNVFEIPQNMPEGQELKVYIWNTKKEELWVDNLQVILNKKKM